MPYPRDTEVWVRAWLHRQLIALEASKRTIRVYQHFVVIWHEMELSDDIYEFVILRRLERLAAGLIMLDNVLLLYRVEHARGNGTRNLAGVNVQSRERRTLTAILAIHTSPFPRYTSWTNRQGVKRTQGRRINGWD